MSWNNFVYALGDFFEWTFGILPILGNSVNYIFLALGFIFFFYWMGQMAKHNREGGKA